MTLHATLSKLLVAVAVFGMLLAPFARQAVAMPAPMAMDHNDAMTADGAAPCCPVDALTRDCAKTCPLIAMCVSQSLPGPLASVLNASLWHPARTPPKSDAPLAGFLDRPRPKPPKFLA